MERYSFPVVVSTHPRTRVRLEGLGLLAKADARIDWHEPFGLVDFVALQTRSFCVVSDSGTIHEDSSVLGFPAVAIRKSTEKAESIDAGHTIISGLDPDSVLRCVDIAASDPPHPERAPMPEAYRPLNVSSKVARIVLGMAKVIDQRVWGDPDRKHVS